MAAMWNLLPELTTEIFVRLPVKNILICKSVSKDWCSLIDDPEFVKTCLKYKEDNQQAFFLMTRDKYFIVPAEDFEGGRSDEVEKFPHPIKHYNAGKPCNRYSKSRCPLKKEIGYCNGLFCFTGSRGALILWNPSLVEEEYQGIPDPGTQLDVVRRDPVTWGFGCHPKTGEYKIVRIAPINKKDKTHIESEVKVFDVSSGLWRELPTIPYNIRNLGPVFHQALVNGILHWSITVNKVPVILSFNIQDEKFMEIPQPVFKQGSPRRITHLGVFEGCLSMLVDFESIYEIWVMKDYNVKESWTKQFTIDNIHELEDGNRIEFGSRKDFTPLRLLENGEILFRVGQKKPRLYSPKLKTEKDFWALLQIHSNELHLVRIENYVESLVSPKKILGTANIEKATNTSCNLKDKKRKRSEQVTEVAELMDGAYGAAKIKISLPEKYSTLEKQIL